MERTIDRTSYRRSARTNYIKLNEKEVEGEVKKKNRKFHFADMLLNQTIISLLIIIGILTANYYEITEVTDWLSQNMSNGYSALEIVSKVKNVFMKNDLSLFSYLNSGERSGEELKVKNSGDNFINSNITHLVSGEVVNSGEWISAVEGINQISEDANAVKTKFDFYLPLKGTITSNFGSRVSDNPIVSTYHTGLDIAANTGTEIYAAHSGIVTMAKMFSSYGNCVMIENGDLITVYAHCSSINVEEGQSIDRGNVIAKVGMTGNATGPHLHFEIRYQGRFVDPQKVLVGM